MARKTRIGAAPRVNAQGAITIDEQRYHVGTRYAGQEVAVTIDAEAAELVVYGGETMLKRLRIKGLLGGVMPFDQMVEMLCRQCPQEQLRLQSRQPRRPHKRWTR